MADIKKAFANNVPTVLTVLAGIGAIGTAVLARKDTLKAEEELEELRRNLKGIDYDNFMRAKRMSKKKMSVADIAVELDCDEDYIEDILEDDIETKDKALIYTKAYIPTAIMATATILCVFGSNHLNKKHIAALAGAYVLSETTFKEYKDKVKDVIGENKAQEIHDNIIHDHIKKNPPTASNTENVGMSNEINLSLWYDVYSDRYFYSNAEKIRRAELETQRILDSHGCVDINEAYAQLGLRECPAGEDKGWIRGSQVRIKIGSDLTDDVQTPIGTIQFENTVPTAIDDLPDSVWFSEV